MSKYAATATAEVEQLVEVFDVDTVCRQYVAQEAGVIDAGLVEPAEIEVAGDEIDE
jgi:hypothetical protein